MFYNNPLRKVDYHHFVGREGSVVYEKLMECLGELCWDRTRILYKMGYSKQGTSGPQTCKTRRRYSVPWTRITLAFEGNFDSVQFFESA